MAHEVIPYPWKSREVWPEERRHWPDYFISKMGVVMKTIISSAIALLSLLFFFSIVHASTWLNVSAVQSENGLFQVNDDDEKARDAAITMYLAKNPPEVISAYVYASLEKTLPLHMPEPVREKALNHVKTNVTPDILKRMMIAGLKRNFTVEELCVLAKYDESQLSDDMKKKTESFRLEISGEIGLLLAAASG